MTKPNRGVLAGISVLDFTRHVAGGFCTRLLADMGARIIKIEPPVTGDQFRMVGPFNGESWLTPPSIGPFFLHCGVGKESIALDLKQPESIVLIKRLVPHADIVVENFTSHVLPSLGLSYEDLRQIRPDIIMCSISGFGAEGPLADRIANDPVIQAMSGMLSTCGEPDGYPYFAANGIADSASAMTAAMAIVAALLQRYQTGAGQHIDISMMHAMLAMDCTAAPVSLASHGEHVVPRSGRFNHLASPWGVLKAPQGRYLVVVCMHDMQWAALARVMGRPDLIEDPDFATFEARVRNRERVHAVIEEFIQTFETAEAACQAIVDGKVIAGVVLNPWEAVTHPQTEHRNMLRQVHHPFTGPLPVLMAAPPFAGRVETPGRAPFVGEHNRPVLQELLGLSDAELDDLHERGVLFQDVTVAHLDVVP